MRPTESEIKTTEVTPVRVFDAEGQSGPVFSLDAKTYPYALRRTDRSVEMLPFSMDMIFSLSIQKSIHGVELEWLAASSPNPYALIDTFPLSTWCSISGGAFGVSSDPFAFPPTAHPVESFISKQVGPGETHFLPGGGSLVVFFSVIPPDELPMRRTSAGIFTASGLLLFGSENLSDYSHAVVSDVVTGGTFKFEPLI